MGCINCQRIARGTVGLTRSVLGIKHVSIDKAQQRLAICRDCSEVEMCPGTKHRVCRCTICGCHLKHKARLRDESCPIGKW